MQITPYLGFDGRCREAFEFYRDVLHGEFAAVMTFGESPMCDEMPPEQHDRIMHAHLVAGDTHLMGGDMPPDETQGPSSICVALSLGSVDEAERVFDAFAEGGSVQMPLEKTFWAERFGMVTDRFGIPWLINGALTEEEPS